MELLHWTYKPFDTLTPAELYAIMQLRNEVFVVEQNCVYQDADNKDALSFHLCGWDKAILVTYCRVIPPGIAFAEASIDRVLTSAAYRKNGTGRELMQRAIKAALQQFNCREITIGAQLYLKTFYTSLGFKQTSGIYLEDGIEHIEMLYAS